MTLATHRILRYLPVIGSLLLVIVLSSCGTNAPVTHTTIQGKLSILQVPSPYLLPGKIVLGPDNNLWFPAIAYSNFGTDLPSGAIGRLAPNGTFRMFPLPTLNSYPKQLTLGPDGNLWFTLEQGYGKAMHGIDTQPRFNRISGEIGKITPQGAITTFVLPSSSATATSIATGPDGNLWFTEVVSTGNQVVTKVGRLTPAGSFSEFTSSDLNGSISIGPIVAGSDSKLWFGIAGVDANNRVYGKMGQITAQGSLKVFDTGTIDAPQDIVVGSDNNLWFTTGNSVARMTTDGKVQMYKPSNNQVFTGGITVNADGALWFATSNAALGRVNTAGTFKFYPFPDNTDFDNGGGSMSLGMLKGIVSGADGTLWLTDADQIGHVI